MDISTLLTDPKKLMDQAEKLASLKMEQMVAAESGYRRIEAVVSVIHGLCTCESSPIFGSSTTVWSLVGDYATRPRGRGMTPTRADLIVVPELVIDQVLHRGTPDPVRPRVSHWSPRTVSGREIADEAIAKKKFGLRSGRVDEVKLESCPRCNAQSAIVCQQDWDYDNGVHSIILYRLCLDCPSLDDIAAAFGDLNSSLLAG